MRETLIKPCIISLALLFFVAIFADAHLEESVSTTPVLNDGKKWRIGYLEGGSFSNYELCLHKLVKGLMELGWIQETQLPKTSASGDSLSFWSWLGRHAHSNYLEFVEDAYWSCGWDRKKQADLKAKIIERLRDRRDIDLMIAMGTWAGQDLANNQHSVPVVVMSASDPVQAGIIKDSQDSGLEHVHARVSPKRYEKQIRVFHQAVGFKRLGITYKNTDAGRSYAAIDDVERLAKELHFEVERCYSKSDPDLLVVKASILECHQKLAPRIDAFYLTIQTGIEPSSLPNLIEPFHTHKIPIFAQRSSEEVHHGALMSLTSEITDSLGLFEASVLAKIFNGTKPGRIAQIFEDPNTRIAINMEVAKRIGYLPPDWVLEMADEVFTDIKTTSIQE